MDWFGVVVAVTAYVVGYFLGRYRMRQFFVKELTKLREEIKQGETIK